MLHGIICPVADLARFASWSTYHLVLAHIVESDEDYVKFYQEKSKCGDFITLDNSAYEVGDGVYSTEDLIKLGGLVLAHEVMAPEVFEDGGKTAAHILEFSKEFREKSHAKIFGVIHGTTIDELKACFRDVYKYVDTIGFSCRLEVDLPFPKGRGNLLLNSESFHKSLCRCFIVKEIFKMIDRENLDVSHLEFHLLGMNHPLELLWYGKEIRSCDSSFAYLNGLLDTELTKITIMDYVKPPFGMMFHGDPISNKKGRIVSSNIDFINRLMN